jgi:dTMP kinase
VKRKREPNSVAVLLRLPAFRRLWAAIAVSSLGDWLGLLATTALAAYLTKDSSNLAQGAAVSGVLLTRLLPDLILGPVAGALVDRFDRRKVAIVGDTMAGLLYVSIIFSGNLLWLLVAQFLVEAIGLFSTPAKQAMWVNVVPRERLAVANQLNYVSVYGMVPVAAVLFALLSTVATFFGVPVVAGGSGALISGGTNTLAIDIALAIDAGTYFFSAFMVLISRGLIPAFVGDRSTSRSIFSLIAEGVSFVRKNRLMRSIYVGILGAFGAGGLVAGVAQAYVATLGAGNAGYGILFGAVFTGLALGMLIGPKVLPNVPRRMIFTPAIGAAGIALIVMSVLQDFLGAAITASTMGVFAGIAWINGFTMIGHEVSDQLRGRVFAFVMSSVRIILLLTIAVGPILAGAIGTYPVTIGDFRFEITGPAVVLAVGGLIAFGVSAVIGRQIGGLTSGLTRRVFHRKMPPALWEEPSEHAGALIAVEGADAAAAADYLKGIEHHLREAGYVTTVVRRRELPAVVAAPGADPLADALRSSASLADLMRTRVGPALEGGEVVLCDGFMDELIVRYRALGLDEVQLSRVAQWAVGGLKPDLTLVVDAVPAAAADAAAGPEVTSAEVDDPVPPATGGVVPPEPAPADEDDERVDPAQAYRDRVSYTPERYLIVRPLSEEHGRINAEVTERIASVLRERSPATIDEQKVA